jgi:hypothetical protein
MQTAKPILALAVVVAGWLTISVLTPGVLAQATQIARPLVSESAFHESDYL